ncbi:MAG: hypothetical protein P1U56_15555 [Saprospiraceae bacterium]|nr:hypothetical protein [Saprospiraceae bacterium]
MYSDWISDWVLLYTIYIEAPQIKKDFSITTGTIYEFDEEANDRENTYTRYKYVVDGKEYERGSYDMEPCEGMRENRTEIMSLQYTVAYNNDDPQKSRILVSPKQFEEYGIPFKDSHQTIYMEFWFCK